MNGFLVRLVMSMDEHPLYLTNVEQDAVEFAKGFDPDKQKSFFSPTSDVLSVRVDTFKDGFPVGTQLIKTF